MHFILLIFHNSSLNFRTLTSTVSNMASACRGHLHCPVRDKVICQDDDFLFSDLYDIKLQNLNFLMVYDTYISNV